MSAPVAEASDTESTPSSPQAMHFPMVKSPSINSKGRTQSGHGGHHYVALGGSEKPVKPKPTCLQSILASKLLTLEDWWSVWLGLLFLVPAIIMARKGLHPTEFGEWVDNPLEAFDNLHSRSANSTQVHTEASPTWGILVIWPATAIFVAIGLFFMNRPWKLFITSGFHVLFLLTCIAKLLGAQKDMHGVGLGASVWSVVIGCILSNTVFRNKLPEWLKAAACDELFIKINVVMLAVDISQILHLGLRGLVVGWIDTPLNVFIIAFIGIKVFKMDMPTAVISGAATSVCGTSAAVAVASIFKVPKESYQTIVAIMSFFTVPMIPLMPVFAGHGLLTFNEETAGAWIGGTVDTTGAVIASATIHSQEAAVTAAIVKMLQNSILGLICLVLSVVVLRGDTKAKKSSCGDYLTMLWDRFPKFVIGFMICSVIISFTLDDTNGLNHSGSYALLHDEAKAIKWSFCIGEWLGTMGFVAIGLNIRFKEMYGAMKGGSLVWLYLIGQCLDAGLTGIAAWLAFTKFHDPKSDPSG